MKKALCVGINDYPGCQLNGCINDANGVANLLKRNYDGTINFDTKCETDLESRSELYNSIEELFSGTGEMALFYFSGHGHSEKGKGYLTTPDYQKGNWGVSVDELINMAKQSDFNNKFIILDCCYSGIAGSDPLKPDCSEISEGLTIMAACSKEQQAKDGETIGVFTSLLLDGLSGGASDLLGNITAGGLYAYIDRCLGPWDQRPVFKTNVSSFSPIVKSKPPIELSVLHQIPKIFSDENMEYSLDPSYEFTNTPNYQNKCIEPYAKQDNVKILKTLQKLESVGLVIPIGEEHMYFAAMNSKHCKLTEVGKYYYNLVKEERL